MTRAGFEPALPKETVLETVALDLSANESMEPPAGLEPAVYRLEVCRLIHWATGAYLVSINAIIIEIARSINSWLRVFLLCDEVAGIGLFHYK